ncbi:MAG: hypothetical protein UW90_C0001G0071 [Candidatus Yanofskybacteria bacterium GW2011_GWB1_45_11]|uniref:Uncharacterized protein n=1 Tax=Candidatus Yanofskybacteria bacterium GW2011_GWB1_45_11 TaxID=1619026 RepID=A0A0G1L3T5_9BACT|nr:MAG: hypothetical protein UW90_C0001G0071 [Candidatus Yanofskybacteria bacterium GW2011_GWB1_45_11]
MKKWSDTWPFLGALALLTIANGDWVLMPFVMYHVKLFWVQFAILIVLLNVELFAWYKFWRWFFLTFLPERKKIRDTIDFTKEVAGELKAQGTADKIIRFFETTFEWVVHPNRWLFRTIKAGGHAGMFFLGWEPFMSGGRLAGTIVCATANFKTGLYSLVAGNCVHILIAMGSWNVVFYLWEKYRDFFFILLAISVLYFVLGKTRGRLKILTAKKTP